MTKWMVMPFLLGGNDYRSFCFKEETLNVNLSVIFGHAV